MLEKGDGDYYDSFLRRNGNCAFGVMHRAGMDRLDCKDRQRPQSDERPHHSIYKTAQARRCIVRSHGGGLAIPRPTPARGWVLPGERLAVASTTARPDSC
jgi:hypothetical protein